MATAAPPRLPAEVPRPHPLSNAVAAAVVARRLYVAIVRREERRAEESIEKVSCGDGYSLIKTERKV
jgi:hypothetical protein